ncbi:HPr-rel-A system PqqD family peptide chaperone, partial [Lactococcus lactis]|uniref:HPr-rel-A system PqqD family peptide chaperone n=1 Tax=Lactococcus lactis TaxID=1358 RepID=UPI003D0FF8CD
AADAAPLMLRYRAAPAAALRQVAMDGLALIYHRASGITHVVASPVPELLSALGDEGLTTEELMAALARDYDLADGDRAALA